MNYKNNIFILTNIHKANDEELVDYTFKRILPKIYNFYKEHRNTNKIIYDIDNCYKKYFPNLYLELLGVYNLSDLTKMIYRKNNYNKIDYIIKLLKEKNDVVSKKDIYNIILEFQKYYNEKKIQMLYIHIDKEYEIDDIIREFRKFYEEKKVNDIIKEFNDYYKQKKVKSDNIFKLLIDFREYYNKKIRNVNR